jgi:DNA-binding LacI/PurR family transcriptional regulator
LFGIPHRPSPQGNLSQRAKGFLQSIRDSKPTAFHREHTLAGGYAMVHQLFRKKYVTAVFAANDAVVFGVLKAAVESSVRIPEDVSLIGFDTVDFTAIVHRPFTNRNMKWAKLPSIFCSDLPKEKINFLKTAFWVWN